MTHEQVVMEAVAEYQRALAEQDRQRTMYLTTVERVDEALDVLKELVV